MRLCELDDCDRSHYGKGLCEMHYQRNKHNGSPHIVLVAGRKKQDRKPCTVDDCGKFRVAHGLCPMHYRRLQVHGDVTTTLLPRVEGGCRDTIHRRLVAQYGRAAEYPCVCGRQAFEWAFTGCRDLLDRETGFPYSTDLMDYLPLCRSCHNTHDKSFYPDFGARLRKGGQ